MNWIFSLLISCFFLVSLSAEEIPLTLENCISRALAENPSLRELELQVEIAQGAARQSLAPPVPSFEFSTENFGGSGEFGGFSQSENQLSYTRPKMDSRKRELTRTIGQFDIGLARLELEIQRRDLISEVHRLFYENLLGGERLFLARESEEVGRQILDLAEAGFVAGRLSRFEKLKSENLFLRFSTAVLSHRLLLDNHRVKLAQLLGMGGEEVVGVAGEWENPPEIPDLEQVMAHIASHPLVAKADLAIARARENLALAAVSAREGANWSYGIKGSGGGDVGGFLAFSQTLPSGVHRAGAEQIARAELDLLVVRKNNLLKKLSLNLSAILSRLQGGRLLFGMVLGGNQARAKELKVLAEEAYRGGKIPFLVYLDAAQGLNEERSRLVDIASEFYLAWSELQGFFSPNFPKETTK